jgi:hypothetical protein
MYLPVCGDFNTPYVATLLLEEWEDDTHTPENGDLEVH